MNGIIFDIKRYAIHDGPGIRTTLFMKGCPLNCWWCHNPEGISPEPELIFRASRCLEECDACIAACPQKALTRLPESVAIERTACRLAGECVRICPTRALSLIGRDMAVDEVMREIEKDRIFYETSQGGVTFSGGEPLMQPEFLGALLEACQERDLHTIVDTSGHTPFTHLEEIADKVNVFFYDLKVIDEKKHQEGTGVSNGLILENLKLLAGLNTPIQIRIPLVPGFNDSTGDIGEIGDFLLSLAGIKNISLLPYHRMASQKYRNLGRPAPEKEIRPPAGDAVSGVQRQLADRGFNVTIGG